VFDHTSSCVCVPEGQAVQALPAARTNRVRVVSSAIHIMDDAQLATASVPSALQNVMHARPYGN